MDCPVVSNFGFLGNIRVSQLKPRLAYTIHFETKTVSLEMQHQAEFLFAVA